MDFNKRAGIDLHIHSNASDGSLSPLQIIALAQKLGVLAISITDHDTIDGVKDLFGHGIPAEIKILSGVELSARPPAGYVCPGSFHILGYGIDLEDPALHETLEELQRVRKNRNPQIIARLQTLGMDITMHDVLEIAGNGQLGRPHIAQVMVQKGYADSIDGAFDGFLGKGQPAYVDKFRLESRQAIDRIRNAGGVAVLAHPYLLEAESDQALEELIITLKQLGLEGLEAYYPGHSYEQVAFYRQLAESHGLVITGGTDYHGNLNPEIQIGSGTGRFYVPYRVYETLIQFLATK